MRKAITTCFILFLGMSLIQSCGENKKTDLVPSGTYQGTAETVDPGESEVYVRTSDDKLLELYFTDKTALTMNGNAVKFDKLKEGDSVEVKVEKKGKKLDPISVEIMK